jgi:Sec-independent protein translocase protein TatA
MKFLFSPYGIVLVLIVAGIIFFPRHGPDQLKKIGKPMRAFDDQDVAPPATDGDAAKESATASAPEVDVGSASDTEPGRRS